MSSSDVRYAFCERHVTRYASDVGCLDCAAMDAVPEPPGFTVSGVDLAKHAADFTVITVNDTDGDSDHMEDLTEMYEGLYAASVPGWFVDDEEVDDDD